MLITIIIFLNALQHVLAFNFQMYPEPFVIPKINQTWVDIFLKGQSIPKLALRPPDSRKLKSAEKFDDVF
jgi:hypothetical protein